MAQLQWYHQWCHTQDLWWVSTCCWESRCGSGTGSHTLWPRREKHNITIAPSTPAQWWLHVTASFTYILWVSKISNCSILQFLHSSLWSTIHPFLFLLSPDRGNLGINLNISRSLHLQGHHPNLSHCHPLHCYRLLTGFPASTPEVLQTTRHSANHNIFILNGFQST